MTTDIGNVKNDASCFKIQFKSERDRLERHALKQPPIRNTGHPSKSPTHRELLPKSESVVEERSPKAPPHIDEGEDAFSIVSAADLFDRYPTKRQPVIDGICRVGETVNVIGPPKIGKSWLIHGMLLSVASGRSWLGFDVKPGRVLLADNELHREELSNRLQTVAFAMGLPDSVLRDRVKVLPLRGSLVDFSAMTELFQQIADDDYSIVAVDAFYRALPAKTSENDNAEMSAVYNLLDRHAATANVAIVMNHHTSKGNQAGKEVTDVGAGAGSISRAADSHIILRYHETEGCAVMEGRCRSFPSIQPMTIQFAYPHWSVLAVEPVLKTPMAKADERAERLDREADDAVLKALEDGKAKPRNRIILDTGMGDKRVQKSLNRLIDQNVLERRHRKAQRQSRKTWFYRIKRGVKRTTPHADDSRENPSRVVTPHATPVLRNGCREWASDAKGESREANQQTETGSTDDPGVAL